MAIDPSIPLGIKSPDPAQNNPLTQLSQVQQFRNSQMQNALMGQQLQNAQLANQQGQVSLQQSQQNMSTQGSNRIAQQTAALLTKPNLTADDVVATIQNEVAQGSVPQQVANTWLQDVQQHGSDPQALRTLLTAHLVGTLSGPEAVRTVFGAPVQVSDGRSINGTTQNGLLNPNGPGALNVPGGSVRLQTSPETGQAIEQIGSKPDGTPIYGTHDQAVSLATGGGQLSSMTNGRVPAALRNPNAQPQPDAVGPQPGGGFTRTISPVQQQQQQDQAKADVDWRNQATTDAVASRQRGAALDNMLSDSSNFQSGWGTGTLSQLQGVAQRLGFSVGADALSSKENFQKAMSNLISGGAAANTDAGRAITAAGTPHIEMSPQGLNLALRVARGNEDYTQARADLLNGFQGNRNAFESQIGSKLDPRAFQYQRMTPEQRGQFLLSLPKDRQGEFFRNYKSTAGLMNWNANGQ